VDRWRLYWANTLGRSAGLRLAPLAVERGRAMAEVSERITNGHNKLYRMRWLWRVLAVIGVCLIASNIYLIVSRHADATTWFQVVVCTVLTVLYASMLRVQRWQGRLVRRSVTANQELAQRHTDG
jgi:peptidoglycan/LPS O-acetylase OafA/YrhL